MFRVSVSTGGWPRREFLKRSLAVIVGTAALGVVGTTAAVADQKPRKGPIPKRGPARLKRPLPARLGYASLAAPDPDQAFYDLVGADPNVYATQDIYVAPSDDGSFPGGTFTLIVWSGTYGQVVTATSDTFTDTLPGGGLAIYYPDNDVWALQGDQVAPDDALTAKYQQYRPRPVPLPDRDSQCLYWIGLFLMFSGLCLKRVGWACGAAASAAAQVGIHCV